MKKILLITFFIFSFITTSNEVFASVSSLEVISKNNLGQLGNGDSYGGSISEDGKIITFGSDATNLVPGDTNNSGDVFIYDVDAETIEIVSVNNLGEQGDGESYSPLISPDGRFVVFTSLATNLVPGDINDLDDVFMYDRDTETIELISSAVGGGISNGTSGYPMLSEDNRYVVFSSSSSDIINGDTNDSSDIFLRDLLSDTTDRISLNSDEEELNNGSDLGVLSKNGRYLLFSSDATNATEDVLNNSSQNIYLRDLLLGTTELISLSSNEVSGNNASFINFPANSVTNDGRYILFSSNASNLVSGDTNNAGDVFLRDRTLGITERINVSESGVEADGESVQDSIDPEGRFISFRSESNLLVPGDTTSGEYDIFVYDMQLETMSRISVAVDGTESNGYSESVGFFSLGARYVVYYSDATNLVAGDSGNFFDVFFAEITDQDNVMSSIEDSAPNNGDVDESGYDDAIEQNVTSFINSVTENYSSIVTTGDCVRNDNPNAVSESSLDTQDPSYDYPLGIISFEVNCKNAGETATVSVFCFCENTSVEGTIARKYNEGTGEYTTIEDAVIEEVTIDGQRALKMTYDVVDGGSLDEDGLSNGTIVDPVGFGRPVQQQSSGGSRSSGSIPKEKLAQLLQNNTQTPAENSCEKINLVTLMKKGSKFGEVSLLQSFLNKNGFNSGVVDGLFGSITDYAVRSFQESNNLISDGIVGPITRGLINSKCI